MAARDKDERWPPVYDFLELEDQIRRIARSEVPGKDFWSNWDDPIPCQGDVVRLRSGVPLIDSDGQPTVLGEFEHWLLIGNSCDFSRDLTEVPWSQVLPIVALAPELLRPEDVEKLRSYAISRRFFLPPWSEADAGRIHFADFQRPVTVDKRLLLNGVQRCARVSRSGWVLLHCCLVRFLARDDGRHAA